MKVFINARFLTQQITGVQQFAHEICRNLNDPSVEYILLAPKGTQCPDYLSHHTFLTIGSAKGYTWEQIELPYFLRKQGSPLLLNFCNTAPLLYQNQFVTIHDLAFMHHPEWFAKGFAKVYRYLVPRIAKRSKKIITVSQTISNQLQKVLGVNVAKVMVAYNGIPNHLTNDSKANEVPKKPFILTVSSINPRKNLPFLIEAFAQSRLQNYQLIIVGAKQAVFQQQVLQVPNNVSFVGYINNDELIQLYKQSELFVSLSLDEGFGIPVLEALHFQCPVLLSDIAVYKECFGNSAFFTSATDVQKAATDLRNCIELRLKEKQEVKINPAFSYALSAKKIEDEIQLALKKM